MVLPTGGRKPGIPGQSRNELTDRILALGSTLDPIPGQVAEIEEGLNAVARPNHVYAETNPAITTASSDISTALQSLLNAYEKVEFRGQGTYMCGPITVPAGTTLIIPEGVTLKKTASSTSTAFIANAGRIVGEGTIDGNKADQSANPSVIAMTTAGALVRGVRIVNGKGAAVYGQAVQCQVVGCHIEDIEDFGIWARHGEWLIENNTVRSTTGASIRVDAYASAGGASNTRVLGNHVDQTATVKIGIELWADEANLAYRNVVANNTVTGASYGISLDKQTGTTCTGNTVYGGTSRGLELAGSINCILSGNTVDGGGTLGAAISCSNTNNSRNTISGNTLRGFHSSGIHIYQGTKYTITGNVIEGVDIATSDFGVRLQQATHVTVAGNQFELIQTAVNVEDSTDVSITGNSIVDVTRFVHMGRTDSNTYGNISFIGNTVKNFTGTLFANTPSAYPNVIARGNTGMGWDWLDYANNIREVWGSGSPESSVTAGPGSIYHRTDGGAGEGMYIKESGTGNTGWVAK